ncbi:MAG: efflux RND transporter periplasmic adaptor subunit [Anaerolineales bacterium]|uniref:Efflux RND transporter periplasmic adaptor subunit n=1 Tax=Candidatus Desulfolinea nitratireducens TaxID=2841698 RepID=A0A8J6TEG3_9CHLR|nr:efflux RND transporter periplasmic adaptor subunit [Candidatus Desulfolinea nitratireducens]MBL6959706.1 efflux RND transporter periplasmic adaptor subunit [Anaerolineales bacterium]
MHKKRPPVPVIVVLLLAVLVASYFGLQKMFAENNGGLTASGTIEVTTVDISPELAGKVTAVLAEESDIVEAGTPLLHLDDSLLIAQRAVASAHVDAANIALKTAQHNYDLALQNAVIAQQASTATDWRFSAPDEFTYPLWYFLKPEQIDAAKEEVQAAGTALSDARIELEKVIIDLDNADFLDAEKRLSFARTAFLVAQDVKIQSEYAAQGGGLRDAAYDAYNEAEDELNAAEAAYFDLINSQIANDVQDARGKVVVAQQRYDVASAHLVILETGAESPAVISAINALEQARSSHQQSEANLDLIDAQMTKLSVYSPISGTILTRNVEPGEFVQPGATVLSIANLADLTITVYVPEDRYGEISLGQQAEIKVDSFPDDSFSASVISIANTAEYTPRNVQTVEGRSSTVYAIKLKVTDPERKLKPGMPGDLSFR